MARALGTDHQEVRLSGDSFRSGLSAALESLDQPTFDAINTYFVSKAVREAGLTVALAGTGGDELYGGYPSFRDLPLAQIASRVAVGRRRKRCCAPAPDWVARAKTGAPGEVAPQTRWGKLGDALASRGKLLDLYQVSYALFTRAFLPELSELAAHDDVVYGLPRERHQELERMIEHEPALHAISMLELSCFLGERLLRDTDSASMAVALEVRVPLIDHVAVERLCAVPEASRFTPLGRKQLLRELALRGLDPALFERPKRGFELPLEVWCRQQLGADLDATLNDADLCARVGLNAAAVARLWRALRMARRACTGLAPGACTCCFGGADGMTSASESAARPVAAASRRYCLITPCRNEAAYIRRTLETTTAQTVAPARWVIVDDGSTDATPQIIAEYMRRYDYIQVITRKDRGARAVGPGVIEAFYDGLAAIDLDDYDYIVKFDADLELPPRYFERVIEHMEADPYLGNFSGKLFERSPDGTQFEERMGDENAVGPVKFYRVQCFKDIGGFVREVAWDGIDGHYCRMHGWIALSDDEPDLRIIHLRPMGSSQENIWVGRQRWGRGKYFMGSRFYFVAAASVYRMFQRPWVVGGVGIAYGYLKAALTRHPRYDDKAYLRHVRRYELLSLLLGRRRALETFNRRIRRSLSHARGPSAA